MLSTRVAAVLEEHGEDIWGHLVDRLFGLGRELAHQIQGRSDFELAMKPEANIVCFRCLPDAVRDATPVAQDQFTQTLRRKHLEEGPQYVVQTRFGGKTWLRCTLMNPLTESEDLTQMLDRLAELADGITRP